MTGNLLEGGEKKGNRLYALLLQLLSHSRCSARETLVISAREGSNSINAAERPVQRENLASVSVK